MAVRKDAPPGAASILRGSDPEAAGRAAAWGQGARPPRGQHVSHLRDSVQKLDSARKASPAQLANPLFISRSGPLKAEANSGMNHLFAQNMKQLSPPGRHFGERGAGGRGGTGFPSCSPGHCPPGEVLHIRAFLPCREQGRGQLLCHGSPSELDLLVFIPSMVICTHRNVTHRREGTLSACCWTPALRTGPTTQ